jgi:hypothetical protein
VKGERLVARVYAHPRAMGPKIDSLLSAILGSHLRNRFISPVWIRQRDIQGRGSSFRYARSCRRQHVNTFEANVCRETHTF